MTLVLILVALAFALIVAEVLFPSFGILSILAATAYAFALVEGFQASRGQGWTVVSLGVVLLPVAVTTGLRILPRTPLGRRLLLVPPPSTVPTRSPPVEMGSLGMTVSALKPVGYVRFADQRISAVSRGEFIPNETPVEALAFDGRSVIVGALASPSRADSSLGNP